MQKFMHKFQLKRNQKSATKPPQKQPNQPNESDEEDDDEEETLTTVIIDPGSKITKQRHCCQRSPWELPSVIGKPKNNTTSSLSKSQYIGHEAISKRGLLNLTYPIKKGIITNWDYFEKILHHIFYNEIRIQPEECRLFLTEKPSAININHNQHRIKKAEIAFETFNIPSLWICNETIPSIYLTGRSNGIIVSSTNDLTYAQCIVDGVPLKWCEYSNIGGNDVTLYLIKLLNKYKALNFNTASEIPIVDDIKKSLGFVSTDYDNDCTKYGDYRKQYELPDGSIIDIDRERFECTQCLFNPSLIDKNDCIGIDGLVYNAILRSSNVMNNDGIDVNIDDMLGNVILEGGNTMFYGLGEMIQQKLSTLMRIHDNVLVDGYLRMDGNKLLHNDVVNTIYNFVQIKGSKSKIKCIQEPGRRHLVWLGASCIADNSQYKDFYLDKKQYEEFGSNIVNRKFGPTSTQKPNKQKTNFVTKKKLFSLK